MIFDKPFSFQEMIRRTIFKSRPHFFNAIDLNKEFLVIHSFMEKFNEKFSIVSNIKFTVTNFSETFDNTTNKFTRVINLTWTEGKILYKGVEFQIPAGGTTSDFVQVYSKPDTSITPKEVKPVSYICLVGELVVKDYGTDPVLCGIQADEIPNSVPTVDVEQYQNLNIVVTENPDTLNNILAILAVIHPRYAEDGSDAGFGFLYYTMNNPDFRMKNGSGNVDGAFKNNQTLFEYVLERISGRLDYLLNERQLVRRFNLADLQNFDKARHNLGLSKVVNHKQLVQAENFRDILDKPLARFNLGLGSSATRNVGNTENDVAPGNVLPVGVILMWSGHPSSIPKGWTLCNGGNGTPDLSGKFIVGYSPASNDYNVGTTGGLEKVKLTGAQSGTAPHSHTITDPGHTHKIVSRTGKNHSQYSNSERETTTWDETEVESKVSKTGITINESTGQSAAEEHENRPPYYAMCYIMYLGVSSTAPTVPTNPPALTYPNYSTPDNTTDNGYGSYTPVGVGSSGGQTVGSGIVLTNPE